MTRARDLADSADKDIAGTLTVDGLTVDGNVGIGTSSPASIIHSLHPTSPKLTLERDSTSLANNNVIGEVAMAHKDSNDAGTAVRIIGRAEGTGGAAGLAFNTGSPSSIAERMRLDASGNVGIGTSSPSSYYANHLVVDTGSSAQSGITIVSDTSNQGMFAFADGTSGSQRYSGYIDYNHSNNVMSFGTNSGSEAMRIDSSGNVGIGTSSPSAVLHVDSSNDGPIFDSGGTGNTNHALLVRDSGNNQLLRVNNNGNVGIGTSSPDRILHLNNSGTEQNVRAKFTNGTTGEGASDGFEIGINASNPAETVLVNYEASPMAFFTSATERMRIDSSGNLLVGTTGTLSMGSSTTAGFQVGGDFRGVRTDGNPIMYLKQQGNDGTFINFYKDTSSVGSIARASNTFQVIANAVSGTYNMLQLGASAQNQQTYYLQWDAHNGGFYSLNDNTHDLGKPSNRWDDVYATNGTIQTSDQNEKNTITDSDLGIDFIKRLTPKSYIFNGKTRTHYGLIAQDVETVLTDISKPTSGFAGFIKSDISEEKDGSEYRYGLRYTEFVAPLIQAVKDQQAIIEDLQARITALEAN